MKTAAERLAGLRWRLTASRRLWSPGARPEMAFLPNEAVPSEPVGHLDPFPPTVRRASVTVRGWVLFPVDATDRVEVFLGGRPLGRARLGVARIDVGKGWESPLAAISGFELTADLGDWDGPDGPNEVVAEAISVTGERHRLEPRSVTISSKPPPPAKLPAPAPVAKTLDGARPRVLVFTHQLGLGGAQLYLLDLLSELVRTRAASFVVVSALDGPVRRDLEEIGIPVHVTSPIPLDDLGSHLGRIEELAGWAEGREFDAVFVNTATTLASPGAEVADRLGLPVVWAIHESFSPSFLFGDLIPEVRKDLDRALRRSTLVFEAEATKRLFEPVADADRCLMLPYGLDFEPIDAARQGFDREAARRKHGIPADARAIVCIGTIEPRKAQALLAQAFDRIAAQHPEARLYFVGGRDDDDSNALRKYIASSPNRDRIEVVPITPDVQPWYGMPDLLVSASDVESLPRTVLEAMAWETPVLATSVFGLPELITHGETGWLCEPRDLEALAEGLEGALKASGEERAAIARAGRALVEERHSLERYGREIAGLLGGP
ncbi:MAG TPA: glycosyltransferase family 4 protein [Solirubrobacterales bacterium]|nr:glycosyltransferase family 4 protein [Solirubrobacterales bacterium]